MNPGYQLYDIEMLLTSSPVDKLQWCMGGTARRWCKTNDLGGSSNMLT